MGSVYLYVDSAYSITVVMYDTVLTFSPFIWSGNINYLRKSTVHCLNYFQMQSVCLHDKTTLFRLYFVLTTCISMLGGCVVFLWMH